MLKIGGIVVCIIVVLLIYAQIKKKKNLKKDMALIAEDKLREAALDRALSNGTGMNRNGDLSESTPFEVSYKAESGPIEPSKLMVQVEEKSELSTKKYSFDPHNLIHIGNATGKNHILTGTAIQGNVQCEIFERDDNVYVRNLGDAGKIMLFRGKQKAFVEEKSIVMKSGDVLLIGKSSFRLEIVKLK